MASIPVAAPVKILLVDDRPENLRVLEAVLAEPERELYSARSGKDALALAGQHEFAVILLDVQMPIMDGYETAQQLRAGGRNGAAPIIFVTAGDRDERAFRGYDVGAVDVIYKPINSHVLRSKVNVFIELFRRAEEIRALHDALEQKVEELENLNRTLSHDLRAPLRSIHGFAEILATDYTGRLDAQADSHIQRILRGSRRMEQMLEDLFRLLQLGALGEPTSDVDSGAVLRGVLEDLGADIAAAGAAVTIATELPTVRAHAGLLAQIFQNLVGNALKFRRAEPPRIDIRAERLEREWRFAVADNGVGIAPEKREKVFGIFQRLVGASVPGSGVGLALVKKAVERHGGRIWVDSEPGAGSTFRFTVPV